MGVPLELGLKLLFRKQIVMVEVRCQVTNFKIRASKSIFLLFSDPKKPQGKLIGIDLLGVDALPGAIFLPGCDFTSPETLQKICNLLAKQFDPEHGDKDIPVSQAQVDIVLSDMAPNSTGMHDVDHPRIMGLVRQALKFAIENGAPGSHFITKIWDGHETQKLEKELEQCYHKVGRLKPPSSRGDSAEVFLFGKGKKT